MAKVVAGVNDLLTKNLKLAAQWHPTKNGSITPQDVAQWSDKKAWWICALSHEWNTSISERSRGRGCPICSGKRVLIGYNDLSTINPELSAQWHPILNEKVTPLEVTANSSRKVWWVCKLFHEWEALISSRHSGDGCPYCSGNRVLSGFNDLATNNPELAAQWHPTENGEFKPQDVASGSNKRAWWVCSLLHEWQASISARSSGNGCPYCSGNRVLIGFNDLGTIKPELVTQWHPMKNGELTPQDVTANANKNVWWICASFHEWNTLISERSRGRGCPTCSGKRILIGYNDLGTINPELAKQWHPTKNGKLTPKKVTRSSAQNVWWICALSHEWEAPVNRRANGSGCPFCSVGITEKTFRKALEKLSKFDFESNRIELIRFSRKRDRAQIDMYNHELKLVIEYDGEWTHGANGPEGKTLEQKLAEDKETTQALVDIGYNVIRIREDSKDGNLTFVPLDAGYESNVFQITYKSFGKDKDNIEFLARRIIEEKEHWFKVSNKVLI